jgi:hypothetical protein
VKVAIHQPHYLPWLGYLAKWAAADVFVFLDTVQYEKNGWQNRNRIKTPAGARWLTVPVHAPLGTPIRDVALDTRQPWRRRHLRAIEHAYGAAPRFGDFRGALATLYATEWTALAPLAVATARWLAEALGIRARAVLASELGVAADDPTARLVGLCRALGADTYLAGGDGLAYMDLARFEAAGIAVLCQRYEHPVYRQQHGAFVPRLSALDLLLNEGPEALPVVRSGDAWFAAPRGDRLSWPE